MKKKRIELTIINEQTQLTQEQKEKLKDKNIRGHYGIDQDGCVYEITQWGVNKI